MSELLIYGVLIFLGLLGTSMIFFWIRDYFISKSRSKDKKEDFINHFSKIGISTSLALSVYQYLQDWKYIDKFPVRPTDDIANIYGIADEDLDDLIIEIAQSNHLEIPQNTNYWKTPINTVEDVIKFVSSFSQKND